MRRSGGLPGWTSPGQATVIDSLKISFSTTPAAKVLGMAKATTVLKVGVATGDVSNSWEHAQNPSDPIPLAIQCITIAD